MGMYRIGAISKSLGLSVDTLRYYEKIGLLPHVGRNPSGLRIYDDKDVSRLKFIQRAQMMNFTLAEIGALLKLRENPVHAASNVRDLTQRKLADIDARLSSLQTLRSELQLLINLCNGSDQSCPIIDGIEEHGRDAGQ